MKHFCGLVFLIAISGSICEAIPAPSSKVSSLATLTDLQNAIKKNDIKKFRMWVEDIAGRDPKGTLLKSKFSYTFGTHDVIAKDGFGERWEFVTDELTLLMLAVLLKKIDIVKYIVKNHADKFDIHHSAKIYDRYFERKRYIFSKNAKEMAQGMYHRIWNPERSSIYGHQDRSQALLISDIVDALANV